jgi:hypothetical protein
MVAEMRPYSVTANSVDIKKNILLKPSRTYFRFYKKGSLNSKAVRIRVKQQQN